MAARTTLAELITEVRSLIGDPAGASQVFSDDQIQRKLDTNRDDIRLLELTAVETIEAGGTIHYYEFYSSVGGNWETDVKLQDASYNILTASENDYVVGKWTFATEPSWPVYITGKVFDLNGAAADLLKDWMKTYKLKFDFSSDNQSFKLSQQFDHFRACLAELEGNRKIRIVPSGRTDFGEGSF